MQGKLISFEPKIYNGVQETFAGSKGTLYKFNVTMEYDGKQETGVYSSTKQQPSWKVGEEYTFEKSVGGQQGQFINYKNMKSLDSQQFNGSFKKSGGGIAFAKQKALEASMSINPTFWCADANKNNFKDEVYLTPSKVIYEHITKSNNEQEIWTYVAAIKMLVDYADRVKDIVVPEGTKALDYWKMLLDKFKIEFETILKK